MYNYIGDFHIISHDGLILRLSLSHLAHIVVHNSTWYVFIAPISFSHTVINYSLIHCYGQNSPIAGESHCTTYLNVLDVSIDNL